MNKLFYKILFSIPFVRSFAEKQYQKIYLRYFQGATSNRLTMDWLTDLESINKALKGEFRTLLSRSRDLAVNNDYIKGYLKRCVTNIAGPGGFKLQNRAVKNNEPDDQLNSLVEEAWDEWCKKEYCDFKQENSFAELQKIMVKQWKRDGNILIKKHYGSNINKFSFAIELLNIEQLDIAYNSTLSNGNVVIMGVEFNESNRRVAYWIKANKPEYELSFAYMYDYSRQSVRIPAEEIIHFFSKDFPNQVVGYPAIATSLLTMHDLQGYEKAAIINARGGASKMGFIQTQQGVPLTKSYEGDAVDEQGNVIRSFSYGEIEQLPPGLEFKGWDPSYPNGEYGSFVKEILRKAATGLGVAYANWVGNLEAVNFSSMRSGLLDERDNWKDEQGSFVDGVLLEIFAEFLKYGMLGGAINVSFANYERANKPEFIGRRWDWVDPRADVEAKVNAVNNNLTTLTDVMAEMGVDFEDYVRRRKMELVKLKEIKQLESELGIGKDKKQVNNAVDSGSNGNGKHLLKHLEMI
jgi:lambda family phage portal protein